MKKNSVLKIFSIVLAMFLIVNSCAYAVNVYTLTDQISYTHTKREILQKMNEIKSLERVLENSESVKQFVKNSVEQGIALNSVKELNSVIETTILKKALKNKIKLITIPKNKSKLMTILKNKRRTAIKTKNYPRRMKALK